MARQRRVKLLCLSIDVITELLNWWKAPLTRMVRIPKIPDAPDDVEVEFIFPDYARQCYFARLYHPTWDEVPDGAMAPELTGIATEFVTVERGEAVDAAWRVTVDSLVQDRDRRLENQNAEIDRLRSLLVAGKDPSPAQKRPAGDIMIDLLRPEVIETIRGCLLEFAGNEPGPLHESARLGLQLADHIRACEQINESWDESSGAAIRRAEQILGLENFDNIDHAAQRVVDERDRLKAELASKTKPIDDYEAGYRTMRDERDDLKRQLAMRPEPFAFEGRGKAEAAIELLLENCPPFQGRGEAKQIVQSLLAEIDRLAQELEFRKATMIIEMGSFSDAPAPAEQVSQQCPNPNTGEPF